MRTLFEFTLSNEDILLLADDRRSQTRRMPPGDAVPITLTLEDDGIFISCQDAQLKYLWSGFAGIEEYEEGVALNFTNLTFYPVAAIAFANSSERAEFVAYVRQRIAEDATLEAQPVVERLAMATATAPAASAPPAQNSKFPQNVANAIRLASFLRVAEVNLAASWGQAVFFALLSMAAPVIWAFATTGGGGTFNWYSLPAALFHIPVLLFAAILMVRVTPKGDKTLAVFQAFLMIAFVIDFVYYAIFFAYYGLRMEAKLSAIEQSLYYGCAGWTALACAIAAARLLAVTVNTRLSSVLISAAFIALPLSSVFRDRSLWEKDYSRENDAATIARNDITSEDNFYRQPLLLDEALAALRPQRKGVTDLYFVGVAGYGPQDVFRREIESVMTLLRERFDAHGHTITLINNSKAANSTVIASLTSLRASLARVAEVMDPEEDVLLLYLTSHGSTTHRFALELWPLQLKELDPATLRALLDESGIKHRVVVISACYSGGFINALKNDDTLVITASAADRNSFGCGNENDWTYFGKAYFDEAMRKTRSFTEAFELAKPVISAREKAEKYTPSNPQISVGKNIASTLERLQSQFGEAKSR